MQSSHWYTLSIWFPKSRNPLDVFEASSSFLTRAVIALAVFQLVNVSLRLVQLDFIVQSVRADRHPCVFILSCDTCTTWGDLKRLCCCPNPAPPTFGRPDVVVFSIILYVRMPRTGTQETA